MTRDNREWVLWPPSRLDGYRYSGKQPPIKPITVVSRNAYEDVIIERNEFKDLYEKAKYMLEEDL